jgi:hypothetical protein
MRAPLSLLRLALLPLALQSGRRAGIPSIRSPNLAKTPEDRIHIRSALWCSQFSSVFDLAALQADSELALILTFPELSILMLLHVILG